MIEQLRTLWDERGVAETDLALDAGGTIVSGATIRATATWSEIVRDLPEATSDVGALVVLGAELGRGAMGAVHTGRQRSLGRDVAVKSPLATAGSIGAQSLLREAWISGQLEHPNVIPVYALYRQDDAPLLVMRRVEGGEWTLGPDAGPIEAQLRTLAQVCHAVHFAHTHGIAHLDLKPSNVMVGNYGEIYLVDWGIAVCLRDDLPAFLPRAADVTSVLGTPAYMAPELAAGDGAAIGPRTDVYLLGAILHEILTGRPPHSGSTLMMTLASAYAAEPPTWPPGVPAELAAIATRALQRERDERFASAADFREALEEYLVHADSLGLNAAAMERCDRIEAVWRNEDDDTAITSLASEAEFAFRQALHVWPENDAARAGLQALLERLIERDLEAKRWQGAQRRLAELPQPRPDMERRAEALRVDSSQASAELKRLRHAGNLDMSADQRSAMAYVGALLWGAALIGLGQLDHWGVVRATHWHMLGVTLGGTAIFGFMVHRFRRQLFANEISRNAVALLSVGWLLGDLFWIGAWAVHMPFDAAVIGVTPVTVFVIAGHCATVDRRLVPHSVAAIIGNVFIFSFASWGLELLGLTGVIVLTMLGRTWRQRSRPATD
jgi:serine/threonine-protein kinase